MQRMANNEQAEQAEQAEQNDQIVQLFMIGVSFGLFPKLATVIKNIASRMSSSNRLVEVQKLPPFENFTLAKKCCLIISNCFGASLRSLSVKDAFCMKIDKKCSNDNCFIGLFSLK